MYMYIYLLYLHTIQIWCFSQNRVIYLNDVHVSFPRCIFLSHTVLYFKYIEERITRFFSMDIIYLYIICT